MPSRQLVYDTAISFVGNPSPDIFWKDALPGYLPGAQKGLAWCGVFNLHCLRQAGLTTRKWRLSYGFLYIPPALPRTSDPQMGDTAYFDYPFQHHAIVEKVTGESLFTVDGNQGAPQTVRRKERALVPRDYVQRALNTHLSPANQLKDDGILGPKSRAAIVDFQKSQGLPLSALADMPTLKALGLRPTAIFFSIEPWLKAAGAV
jgi:hypothetical protein